MINAQVYLHYNYTGKLDHRPTVGTNPGTVDIKTIVCLIISCIIVLENLTVLVAIWRNHRFHNRMYYFIGNLALCDLLAGVAYLVNLLLSGEKTLQLSPPLWFVREGSVFVALGASIFSLLAIAIERHLTMIKMRPYDANKNYRVFLLIGTCWLIAIALGALPILGWNCLGNLPDCSTVLPLYTKKYVAFCITVYMVLLLAMSVLYARIYILVKSSSQKVSKHSNSEHAMSLLRTVIIVVGVFIACWTPLFVLLLVDVACKLHCSILYKADWFIAVAVLNSAMNPVIYTLASREMRRAFLGLLCGICYRGRASASDSGNRQSLEPSQSRSKSWSSQNNPCQNQQSGRQAELENEQNMDHNEVSVVTGGAIPTVL
ncbi:sphingosine 1-phosphate receptor 3 [Mastacembelus armatus]|uniref:Sphingosine-1-phosphate receptor 3 n=1 Tax=Mastacembelus armatus TaxID=205130 RepID=A0A3Q3M4F0_9TELE|nr:sphingosine 1-phosphate receptor 3-like [Mastacembelus armatus]XP_026154132.1 sphingosine 1-phosphate receptor 3-like [Mastacembelus armatus]